MNKKIFIILYHKSTIKLPGGWGGAYLFQAHLRGEGGGGLIETGAYLRGATYLI